MKINLAYPRNDTTKQFDIDDERLRKSNLYDHRLGEDVEGKIFSDDWEGYVLRITGGSDKDGFPMMQGVLVNSRVRLLLSRGTTGFNAWRGRSGERRRKSVRGCIVAGDIACLNVTIVKTGANEIDGVTNVQNPRRLGPKRASKIRRLFGLGREDDVRPFVVRRKVEKEGKKPRMKGPRVQRLVTPAVKARRAAKVAARKASLQRSHEQRRAFLSLVAHRRMAARQRNNARVHRQREVQFKELAAQMSKAPAAAAKKTAKK
jgi:small subunit ribosomal protein S6e